MAPSQSSEFLAILSSSSSQGSTSSFPSKNREHRLEGGKFDSEFPSFSHSATPTKATSSDLDNSTSKNNSPPPSSLLSPDNYGLEGLIHAIRTINSTPDQSTPSLFSLGSDLSTLGLDLNSSDPLYPKFTSPWIDLRGSVDSLLPSCYFVPQSLNGLLGKIASLNDETLFYLFYGMPRDKGQVQAAIELFQRGWRYHRGLKLWFSQASTDSRSAFFSPQSSDSTSNTASTAKSLPSDYSEKGTFVFFDFSTWQRITKEFVVQANMIELAAPTFEK